MKRLIRITLMLCFLIGILTVCAFAADEGGIYNLTVSEAGGVSIDVLDENGEVVPLNETPSTFTGYQAGALTAESVCLYPGAAKLRVAYNDQSPIGIVTIKDAYGTVIDMNASSPTMSNPKTVTLSPSMAYGNIYYVYAGLGARTLVGAFVYDIPHTIGDLDKDGTLTPLDALYTLRLAVGRIEMTDERRSIANVYRDDDIDGADALTVLMMSAGIEGISISALFTPNLT